MCYSHPFLYKKRGPNESQPQTLILIYESEENYFLPKSNWLILVIKEKKLLIFPMYMKHVFNFNNETLWYHRPAFKTLLNFALLNAQNNCQRQCPHRTGS